MRFFGLAFTFFFQQHGLTTKAHTLFFSEYVEGSGDNKAIEICNPTGGTVDLSSYTLEIYNNGASSATTTIPLSGAIASGDAYVIADDDAATAITDVADLTPSIELWNGDDAVVLRDNNNNVVDSFGRVGSDPGTQWGCGVVSSADNTLRRKSEICQGDTNTGDSFDPETEWEGFPEDTFGGLGVCSTTCTPSTANLPTVFFSEYIEGSSFNKAIEICNPTGEDVDLSGYTLEMYFNGNTCPNTVIDLVGVVADGDTYVVADDGAVTAITDVADLTPTNSFFNGDDAIVLRGGGKIIDSIGQVGVDPGTQWGSGLMSTQDNTLRRKPVFGGDTHPGDSFDPATEWDGFPINTFDDLGVCPPVFFYDCHLARWRLRAARSVCQRKARVSHGYCFCAP